MAIQQLGQKVWHEPEGTGYIMLDVTDNIKPFDPLEIDGQKLLPKSEYHCSLVAARKLVNNEISEDELVGVVRKFLQKKTIRFNSLTKELFVCRKDGEVTVIAGAEVIGLEALRAKLKRIIPDYSPLFPHVTLLKSANSQYGIGINSEAELENYCVKL